ncbi:MAG: extracellular solute-binding protein [Crenarchaeota archaeon]|nr:extracellular solute-binding protein [Thermoproteota archaeon]
MPAERGLSIAAIVIAIIAIIIAGIAIGQAMSKPHVLTKTVVTTVVKSAVPVTKTVVKTATATVTKTATMTATVTKTSKPIVLTIEYGEPWKDLVQPAIQKFEAWASSHGYNVQVKQVMLPYGINFMQRISSDFAAGTAGDVVIIDSFMIPAFAKAGYLYPLDNFVKNWPDWQYYPEPMKKIVTWFGHVYGIMIDTDVRMLWYRKDIFKMCGLPVPWQPKSWQDIIKAAEKLKSCAPKIEKALGINEFYPLYFPAGTKWGEATTMQGFYMLLLGAAKPPYNRLYDYKTHKWICKSTALYRSFWFYVYTYKNGLEPVSYNFVSNVWGTMRKVFSEGKVAILVGGSWEWGEGWGPQGIAPLKPCLQKCGCTGGKCTTSSQIQCYTACEAQYIGFAKMPSYNGSRWVTISGGWAIVINDKLANNPEKLQLAWKLITFITSRDNEAQYCAKYGKICPRSDCAEVPIYAKNTYLKEISQFLKFTDFRDALPGYTKVSYAIQQVTGMIAKGEITNAMTALNKYCDLVKRYVGANNVEVLPVQTS